MIMILSIETCKKETLSREKEGGREREREQERERESSFHN